MVRRLVFVLAAIAFACGCTRAMALPAGAPVILGFGDSYARPDGSTSVHRGADVACSPGDAVLAPLPGEVSFVGKVPSSEGGTMLAVSIRSDAGTISLMPFEATTVTTGEMVSTGTRLGSAASSGDPSSSRTHLHVGLKKGSMYLDPAVLLVAPGSAESAPPESVAAPEPAPEAANQTAGSPAPVAITQGAAVMVPNALPDSAVAVSRPQSSVHPARAGQALTGRVEASSPSRTVRLAASESEAAGRTSNAGSAGREIAPGVALVPNPARDTRAGAVVPGPAPAMARGTTTSLPGSILGRMRALGTMGLAVLASSTVALIVLLSLRAGRRSLIDHPLASRRLGYVLQHLRAGDTLRGLTSCPGPLPSQSRGRSAQGR